MPPVSPIQAAIGALIADVAAVAVGFGVLNSTLAGTVTTAAISAVSVAFVIANAIHHTANAKLAAQKPAVKRSTSASGSVTVGKH